MSYICTGNEAKKKQIDMKTLQNLQIELKLADVTESNGRQIVANACKKLYNLIEDVLYNKYGEDAIVDAYNDLTKGDFSEPFNCQTKKQSFNLYFEIYNKIA